MDIARGTPFDPTIVSSGTFQWDGGEGTTLVVINESWVNMYLNFHGGQKGYMPANDRRQFKLVGIMAQVQNSVGWSFQSGIQTLNTVNQVVVEVYQPGEDVPETYPSPLIRQANVFSV